jgi:hypothetical protein
MVDRALTVDDNRVNGVDSRHQSVVGEETLYQVCITPRTMVIQGT